MKKFLSMLLVLCMVLSSIVVVSAAGADEWVKTSFDADRTEFAFTEGTNVTPAAINIMPAFDEGEKVNINNYQYVDLTVYAYNPAALAELFMQFEMTSAGKPDEEENCYSFNLSELNLQEGWNVVRIPMEKFTSGPARLDSINFMRCFSAVPKEATGNFFLKITSISLNNNANKAAAPTTEVTLPEFVKPEVKEPVYVEDTFTVEFNKEFSGNPGTISPGAPINFNQKFDPQDMTDVEYVELYLNVDKAAQFMGIEFQFEITSGGANDSYESNYTGTFSGLTDGVNVIKIPIEKFSNPVNGGCDFGKVDYVRMYSQAGTITEAFKVTVEKVVFVNPEEKPTSGVVDSIMIFDCEDVVFDGFEVSTEQKTQGTSSNKKIYGADQATNPGSIMWRKALETAVDASAMTRFAFDVYVSNAAAMNAFDFCLELTSAGTSDQEEYQIIKKLGSLTADKTLVDGWNTCYIDIVGATGCDFTRFNFIRFFSNTNGTLGAEVTVYLDNFRFEKFVEPTVEGPQVEEHSFTVFADDEAAYLLRTSAGNNGNQRFSDAQGETVYKFTISNRYGVKKVVFSAPLGAQLLLQVSQDDQNWTTIYEYVLEPGTPANKGMATDVYEYDITDKVDLTKSADIYIRIADSHPAYVEGDLDPDGNPGSVGAGHGWGGSIYKSSVSKLTVEYEPLPDAELDQIEMTPSEGKVPLFGFNANAGGMDKDKDNKTAGSASAAFTTKEGQVFEIKLNPVNATGMDTLVFDLYVSDVAYFDKFAGQNKNSGLEITSSGTYDKEELSWTLAAIKEKNIGGELKAGWNHIVLPLDTAAMNQGGADFKIDAINYIRFFMVGGKADDGDFGFDVKIDNMYLDNSGIARQEAIDAENKAKAEKVDQLIDKIGEVTLESENKIVKAENAYKDLTAAQRKFVTKKDVLEAARDAYDALVAAQNPDGGNTDGGNTDGGNTDGGNTDGGNTDGGNTDGGNTDGGENGDNTEKKGCGSALTVGAGAMMLLAAAWVTMAARKKED